MKISTKGQYALKMMLDLAVHDNGEYIPIKNIAMREDLPEKYLEQITTMLLKAGYVRSIRGSKGGYRLTDEPHKYTVGMILRTIEGSLAPVSCVEENGDSCPQRNSCITYGVWQEINDAVNHVIDHITLADLVKRYQDQIGNDYVI